VKRVWFGLSGSFWIEESEIERRESDRESDKECRENNRESGRKCDRESRVIEKWERWRELISVG